MGRAMTELQRIIFCNAFVVAKVVYIAQVIPINNKILKKCQGELYRFVWGNKIEKLKLEEMYADIIKGGMGFINISCKTKSLFLNGLIKTITEDSPIQKITNYWVGQKIRFFKKPEPNRPYCESTPKIFVDAISNFKKVIETDPTVDPIKLKPKYLYTKLAICETEKPKALEKNPNITQESCKNLKSLKCEPRIKQHMFNQINNILPTKERLHRCKQINSPTCNFCPATENTLHVFQCPKNQKAVDWLIAEIKNIDPSLTQILPEKIFVLNINLQSQGKRKEKSKSIARLISLFSHAL